MKKQTNLTLSEEIRFQMKAYADSKDVSVSELVEDVVADFLWRVTGISALQAKYGTLHADGTFTPAPVPGAPAALTVPPQPPLETLADDAAQAIAGKRGPGGRKPSRMTAGKKATAAREG